MNYLTHKAQQAYDAMKFKEVLKFAFYEMINIKDEYILYNEDNYSLLNPTVMIKFFKTFFILINPIAPHWTEYMYKTYLNPLFKKFGLDNQTHMVEFLAFSKFPNISNNIDSKLFMYNKYIKSVIHGVTDAVNHKLATANKSKKKGGDKNANTTAPTTAAEFNGVVKILYMPNFTTDQLRVYEILKDAEYKMDGKIVTDYKTIIRNEMKNLSDSARTVTLQFASHLAKEVELYGMEVLKSELPFSEIQALKDNMSLLNKLTKVKNIEVVEYNDSTKPKKSNVIVIPGKPLILVE